MVRNATLAVAACAATGLLTSCASSHDVPVVAGGTSAGTSTSAASSPSATSTLSRPAKPAAEHLPDSKLLTVALHIVPGSAAASRTAVITDPAKIARIAAELNALPTRPNYPPMYCPMQIDGPYLTLVFQDSANGPQLAEVKVPPKPGGQCTQGIQVTVGGVSEPRLDDSGQPGLYAELTQTAGLGGR
jgi:hypothetical protein